MHSPSRRRPPWLRIGFVTIAIILLDQLSKAWALSMRDTLTGAEPAVGFTLRMNTGILFSLPISGIWAYVLAAVVLGTILPLMLRTLNFHHRGSAMVVGAVLGGALGNLIDRIRFDAVVDFVKLWSWPVFNVADASLVCAVLACLVFGKVLFREE